MSYRINIPVILGAGKAGLTDLRVQLFDNDGVNVGSAISTGFVARGGGNYMWSYDMADGFQGGGDVYSNAAPSTILGTFAINPQEAEYTDAKVSSRSTLTTSDLDARLAAYDPATGTEASAILAAIAALNNLSSAGAQAATVAALAAYDAATGSDVSALNNLSSADVQAATAAALTAYDPPTKGELDDAIATIAAAVWAHTSRTLYNIQDGFVQSGKAQDADLSD